MTVLRREHPRGEEVGRQRVSARRPRIVVCGIVYSAWQRGGDLGFASISDRDVGGEASHCRWCGWFQLDPNPFSRLRSDMVQGIADGV